MLHILFLIQNIFFGVDEGNFFGFTITYGFSRDIAYQSLLFSLACAISFAVGYKLLYRNHRRPGTGMETIGRTVLARNELLVLNTVGLLMIAYMLVVIGLSNFNYTTMVAIRESSGFIFELRIIFLLLLSHVVLNHTWKQLWTLRKLKVARRVVLLYFICLLLFQARSAVFELVAIIAYSYLVRSGDKVKLKYLVILIATMIVPNIIILGRLGVPKDPHELINGLFSSEYAIIFNNFLSAAIASGSQVLHGLSFLASLQLLIPSPVRDALGMAVVKSDYYTDLAAAANVGGGGFSLLAEMYSNFGWFSLGVFGLLGTFVGHWNSRATRAGVISIKYSAAPLLYIAVALSFRNDFGVFLKYSIQLLVVSWFLGLLLPQKKPERSTSGNALKLAFPDSNAGKEAPYSVDKRTL